VAACMVRAAVAAALEIIFEINRRFLDDVRARFPGDTGRVERVSLIEEGGAKHVRMANLAIVGSHSTNGVAGYTPAYCERRPSGTSPRSFPSGLTTRQTV